MIREKERFRDGENEVRETRTERGKGESVNEMERHMRKLVKEKERLNTDGQIEGRERTDNG